VRSRNAHGVAASVSAMFRATPERFGDYPINEQLIEFLCAGAAALCAKYDIDAVSAESCYTHAEAAVRDGYFLDEAPDARWDFAVLQATSESPESLKTRVSETGNHLRLHIQKYKGKLLKRENETDDVCGYCASLTAAAPR
jgi:hypothetical protein